MPLLSLCAQPLQFPHLCSTGALPTPAHVHSPHRPLCCSSCPDGSADAESSSRFRSVCTALSHHSRRVGHVTTPSCGQQHSTVPESATEDVSKPASQVAQTSYQWLFGDCTTTSFQYNNFGQRWVEEPEVAPQEHIHQTAKHSRRGQRIQ